MENFISIHKSVPVVGSYDVVVCGGGPAGIMAAIASARQGARTALVEQYGFLGGMATAGYVAPLSVFTYKGEKVIGGIPWEFVERLQKMGGGLIEEPLGNVAFDPELYKLLCQRMALQEGIDLYLHSYVSGCNVKHSTQEGSVHLGEVIFENKNGSEAIAGKVFIDCTGDADLANMAGVGMQESENKPLQPLSTYFILSGVDTKSPMVKEAMHHNKQGENCHCLPVRNKLLELKDKIDLPEFGGPWFCTTLQEGVVTVNMTRTSADACDNRDYTRAECELREQVFRMAKVLKEHFPEFRDSFVSAVSVTAGVRETRRIKGIHTITGEEYLNAHHYPDSISRGAHPIDIHIGNGADQQVTFLESPAYVPYRALVSPNHSNLLVAGRCISADKTSFASLRVQASCMGTGQAAGVAAAQCALSGTDVRKADVTALVEKLRAMGANI